MNDASLVLARPAQAARLVLLFHGVGASAADLAPLGTVLSQQLPEAVVVSVDAPNASTLGRGREWFSVVDITEASRPARIAQALPAFRDTVAHWQRDSGIAAARTTLVGFSQGAIMALAATQHEDACPAGQVVAVAGRYAALPDRRPTARVHLVHGEQDAVVPPRHAREAFAALQALGADVSLDLLPGLGHGIDGRAARLVASRVGEG